MPQNNNGPLLKPAEKQTAYLKAGILGFAGSGKTFTAAALARGLALLEQQAGKPKKPVAFFDTETGSDYIIDSFRRQELELVVAKTRAFSDLLTVVKEAEQTCSVLIVDSISHVWTELVDAYLHKKGKDRLAVWDWNPIKTEWRQFTDLYLCSPLHIIICGRAGNVYEEYLNERGEKEILKTGTKMRVETEFGYEPSLLIEMERIQPEQNPKKKKGSAFVHRATILKDRSDIMMGAQINDPSFKDFLPVIKTLNIGGEHFVLDTSRTSDEMIQNPERSQEDRRKFQEIYTEEIEGQIVSAFPGQSAVEKKIKADMLEVVFDSRSWTKIKMFPPEELVKGLQSIKYLCRRIAENEDAEAVTLPWLRGELVKSQVPEVPQTEQESLI
jgi:hypothetical protein